MAKIYWQVCQKCNLGVQGNTLKKNNLPGKSQFFIHLRTLSKKNVRFWQKEFQQVRQNSIPGVQGNVLRKKILKRKVVRIIFVQKPEEILACWQDTFFGEIFLEEKEHVIFYRFQKLIKKRSYCRQKFSAGSPKLRLTSPQEIFEVCWEKSIFLFITIALSTKNLNRLWRKFFGMIVKLLRVHRNILGRSFFIEKIRVLFFELQILSKNFPDFWRKTFSSFVKTSF